MSNNIAVASDHAGYGLKQYLIDNLDEAGKKPYENLKKLSEHFNNILGKLQGPNRVV